AGNFVPFQVLTIPVLRLMQDISVAGASPYGSPVALILFHAAFQTGFCVFFMRNFIAALPTELIEAARMEGANEFQIYFRVIVPLIRPALAALGLLIFTFVWNDFYWSLVLNSGTNNRLAPAMLTNLATGQWKTLWNVMAAGSIIVALPPLLFFFFLQRQFVAGLTLGANKG
ncbi:MAG: carbohydrate ABC transporter permease, partial [Alphaproteobacteria bacterium]